MSNLTKVTFGGIVSHKHYLVLIQQILPDRLNFPETRWGEWTFKVKNGGPAETVDRKKYVTWPGKFRAASSGRSTRQ